MDFISTCSIGKTWRFLLGRQWKEDQSFQILTWFFKRTRWNQSWKIHRPQKKNTTVFICLIMVLCIHKTQPLWVGFVPMVRSITCSKDFHKSTRWVCFSLSLLELSIVFLGTKTPKQYWSTDDRVNQKCSSIKYFSSMRRFLGCSAYLKCSCPSSPVFSVAVKLVVSQKQNVEHFMLSWHTVTAVSLWYHSHVGRDWERQAFLIFLTVASILLARFNLSWAILTEMTFQKSSNHRIWIFWLIWVFNFTWFSYQGKTRQP